MKRAYENLRLLVKTNPLALSTIKDKSLLRVANSYLPYDTGIEIECSYKKGFYAESIKAFKNIPHIKAVDCDGSEQRFRIPKGINGLICLYHLSLALKKYSNLNPDSGIHYHIDCTDISLKRYCIIANRHTMSPDTFILKALKSWGYTGTYNSWQVSRQKTAVRFHARYQTIEFRIGEMTFDYELLIKRIINCQNITRKLKSK
jgi:hypothetical protein